MTETPAAGDGFRRNAGSRPAMIGAGGAGGARSQSGKRGSGGAPGFQPEDAGCGATGLRHRMEAAVLRSLFPHENPPATGMQRIQTAGGFLVG